MLAGALGAGDEEVDVAEVDGEVFDVDVVDVGVVFVSEVLGVVADALESFR